MCELLPLEKASELFELYSCHVNGRRGVKSDCIEARAYRKLLELEEAILLWEELQKEPLPDKEGVATRKSLLRKMQEVGFSGIYAYLLLFHPPLGLFIFNMPYFDLVMKCHDFFYPS